MAPELITTIISLVISTLGTLLTAFFYLGSYKEKVNRLEKDFSDAKKNLQEVRDKVISCETTLKEREPLTKRESPISLTDRGNEFLKQSKGDDFIKENYSRLKDLIESQSPKTSYDIQEKSKEILKEESEHETFNDLKEFLFREGFELNDLITVMGICLRDKILKEKGIDIKDIDNHDPHNNKKASKFQKSL